ncbi:unnamed protein product [Allacma fusca]|uniref:tRNA (guanine(10)-N(2))-methyltransferase TRMT11 n=1 Tax=Allacma fusca TaxID=39272 RepID=A0A8J2KAR4_9HEXA|nr:unnamed protein product [Allacma fusca]
MPLKSFLFWFSNEQSGFRFTELESIFRVFRFDLHHYRQKKVMGPFVLMNLPSEDHALKIMSRSVLAHSCVELWSIGDTLNELHDNFRKNLEITEPYVDQRLSLKVETFGKTISMAEKVELIDTFEYIPLKGPIDLKNPELRLKLVQFYGLDPNNVPEFPIKSFFGRWIADGQRHLMAKVSLKDRKFIGNTSMDPLLSLLMANFALIKPNDLVYDPFVGTGSILIAAAMMGGYIIGTDIDYLMLHARTRPSRARAKHRDLDESVRANFIQYGIESQYIDILVADASRPMIRDDIRFDAIITDPPYGVREPTEKIGSLKSYKIKEEHVAMHIPSKIEYCLCDIICDLINNASRRLTINGRLVFWIPVSRDTYEVEKLPSNPCFELIANCEQILTATASRRLLVMEKIREPDESTVTIMDSTALMYRFKFFENDGSKTRKERKKHANQNYGKGCKRGQLLPGHTDATDVAAEVQLPS